MIDKMGRPRYICNTCKKDFTRKWNAFRHRNDQHQGLAEIIPLGEFSLRQSYHLNFLGPNQQHTMDDNPEEILLDDTLSKLAPRVEELGQLLSYNYDRAAKNFEGNVIMRAISSSDPIKQFDESLTSIRKGVKCGMVTSKVASYLGVSPSNAETIIRCMLHSSQRTRSDRIMGKDIFYQRGLSYDAYAFESTSYYFSDHTIFANGMITEGHIRRFY